MPKVSIIIPVHNAEKYISQCLNSVINQTLNDIEIICIDDGSTDSSFEILSEYEQKDKRIKVYQHSTSKSALGARKTGVMAASGDYIMFLDADDYLACDACELAYNKIVYENVDILHFSMAIINCGTASENNIAALSEYVKPYEQKLYGDSVFNDCFLNNKYRHTPVNKIYRTEVCKNAYLLTEDIHLIFAEDLYAYFIISECANSYCGWNSKPLYYYCYGRGITATSNKYNLIQFENNCRHAQTYYALERYCDKSKCKNDKSKKIVLKNLYNEWIGRSVRIWKNNLDLCDKEKGEELLYKYWGKSAADKAIDKNILFSKNNSAIDKVKILLNLAHKKGIRHSLGILLNN